MKFRTGLQMLQETIERADQEARDETALPIVASPDFDDDTMACPFCAEPYTDIEEVVFSYRQEDKTPHKATFDAVNGVLRLHGVAPEEHSSRRQWVGLVIDCESCPGGMLVFAQHKGVTHVIKVPNPDRRAVLRPRPRQLPQARRHHGREEHPVVITALPPDDDPDPVDRSRACDLALPVGSKKSR